MLTTKKRYQNLFQIYSDKSYLFSQLSNTLGFYIFRAGLNYMINIVYHLMQKCLKLLLCLIIFIIFIIITPNIIEQVTIEDSDFKYL